MGQIPETRESAALAQYAAATRARPTMDRPAGFVRLGRPDSASQRPFQTISTPSPRTLQPIPSLPARPSESPKTNRNAGRVGLKNGREAESRFVASVGRVLEGLGYETEIERSGELDARKIDARVRWRRSPQQPWTTTDVQVSLGHKSNAQRRRLEKAGIQPVAMPVGEPPEVTDARVLALFKHE